MGPEDIKQVSNCLSQGLLGAVYPTPPTGKIYAAMAAIMNDIEAIGKNSVNTSQNFKFRGIDSVYDSLHPLLAKHKIFTVPKVVNLITEERATSNGKPMIYRVATIEYTFYAEDGSYITATVVGEAGDSGDKAMNKAMAIAHKYCLVQVFTIPTKDLVDPDAESHDLAPPPPKQQPAQPKTTAATPFKFK